MDRCLPILSLRQPGALDGPDCYPLFMLVILSLLACQDGEHSSATVAPQGGALVDPIPPPRPGLEDAGLGEPEPAGREGMDAEGAALDAELYGSSPGTMPGSAVLAVELLGKDPPEEEWWGPPAELSLDATSASELLLGEWSQVREPSLEHHILLLTLLSEDPALTDAQLTAAGMEPSDVAYIESMRAMIIESPSMKEELEEELAHRQHIFEFTMDASHMTITTRKTTLKTEYTVQSVYKNQISISRLRASGEEVTTLVTFVDSNRIRVKPSTDDPLTLRFSRSSSSLDQ
ncbi:MAG: hypothetical protein ACI8RZ_005089 [Myxococcota bacterium]|jgi:hypothetical protein